MALVDSLPVAKTDIQTLPTMLELRENGGRRHSRQHNTSASALPARVDVTCDKFDNWLYGLKTDNRLETGKLAY